MYLERGGWILLRDNIWNNHAGGLEGWLGDRDSNLRTLHSWGESQLVPKWDHPQRPSHPATLVDLKYKISANTIVLPSPPGRPDVIPNALVPLAVHGCGITCLVLYHSASAHVAHKLGIINMPPYILAQGTRAATLLVGAIPQ
jgi:hypothetical protein